MALMEVDLFLGQREMRGRTHRPHPFILQSLARRQARVGAAFCAKVKATRGEGRKKNSNNC